MRRAGGVRCPVHWLDLVIVAVVAWTTFSAFTHGLIRELVTIVAVILGGILAGRLYGQLSENISFLIENEMTRNLVAFVSIFAGIIVLGQLAATLVRSAASMLMLGPFDHVGGALFGFAKGALFVEFLLIGLAVFPAAAGLDGAMRQSSLAPLFLERVPMMLRLLPTEFGDTMNAIQVARSHGIGLPAVTEEPSEQAGEGGGFLGRRGGFGGGP